MLKIYNTKTKSKEEFVPITPGKIGIYVCGVTVYDYCHIGHARTFVAFDTIVRYLKWRGFDVNFVRNITDIDDKIIKKAIDIDQPVEVITEQFITALHEDCKALGLLVPTEEPRATEFMSQMVQMIQTLQDKRYAYVGSNGDVYYDVKKNKKYGELSHRNLDDLQSGARIEVNKAKRCPLDFVLWKMPKPNEPAWDSPWGKGRPGWHLECSVMSMHYLGETFDIHGGGLDLAFPHHENECAQSEACTDSTFVNTWMHAGFLQMNKEKMSKSIGNIATIREVLATIDPEVVRYFMSTGHYRSSIDYSLEQVALSRSALERLYISLRGLPITEEIVETDHKERFINAMDDDFNTPEALAVLFDLAKEINRERKESIEKAAALGNLLRNLAGSIGLLKNNPEDFLQGNPADTAKIEDLIETRTNARKEKNWQLADKVRDELQSMGIELEDEASGTIWRRIK